MSTYKSVIPVHHLPYCYQAPPCIRYCASVSNHLLLDHCRCLVMRPNPAFESTSRSRNPSNDHPHPPATSSGPTTFFLASESDLSRRGSTTSIPQSQDPSPVRTLKETIDEANRISPTRRSPHSRRDGSRRRSTIRPRSIEQLRPDAVRNNTILASSTTGLSTPLNPSSQEPSLPNSPKSYSSRSLARSDDELTQDGNSSQAIESGDEDSADNMSPSMSMHDSAPQLIMPSIKMPSRRPFTDNGKQLGKLKILVTGSKGEHAILRETVGANSTQAVARPLWSNQSSNYAKILFMLIL